MKLLIPLILMISACVTPYQQKGWMGGYEDLQVNADHFQISYYGNGYTSGATIASLWLQRSAEVAQDNGFPFFEVVSEKPYTETKEFSRPVDCAGATYDQQVNVKCMGGDKKVVNRHTVVGVIKGLKEMPAASNPNIFETSLILKQRAH